MFYPAVGSPATTELLPTEAVDGNYFTTLGVTVPSGRSLSVEDDAGARREVVLSHALWRRRFAANPNIVGQTVRVSGHPFEVISVAPESCN